MKIVHERGELVTLDTDEQGNLIVALTTEGREYFDDVYWLTIGNLNHVAESAFDELLSGFLDKEWHFITDDLFGAPFKTPLLTDEMIYGDDFVLPEWVGAWWYYEPREIASLLAELNQHDRVTFVRGDRDDD